MGTIQRGLVELFTDLDKRARPGREPKNRAISKFQTLSDTVQLSSDTVTTNVQTPPYQYALQSYRNAVIADGPTSLWEFGEMAPAVTANDAVGGNHGTYTSVLLGYTPPGPSEPDRCAFFDNAGTSTSYVSVAHTTTLSSTAAVTLEAWVKPTSLADPNGASYVVGKTPASSTGSYALLVLNDGRIELDIRNAGTVLTFDGSASTALLISTGVWSHIVATFTDASSSVRLYVNGASALSTSSTGAIGASTGAVRVGRRVDTLTAFTGYIDEVAVYGTALSSAQVAAHYQVMTAPAATGNALVVGAGQFR